MSCPRAVIWGIVFAPGFRKCVFASARLGADGVLVPAFDVPLVAEEELLSVLESPCLSTFARRGRDSVSWAVS